VELRSLIGLRLKDDVLKGKIQLIVKSRCRESINKLVWMSEIRVLIPLFVGGRFYEHL
jgi:hypothetical protein